MNIKPTYLITVFASTLILFWGHKIMVTDIPIFNETSQEVVTAKVERIIERVSADDDFDAYMLVQSEKIIFSAKAESGKQKGQSIVASQQSISRVSEKEISVGDKVILINFDGEWFFTGYMRIDKLLILGIIFTLCVILFGGRKGFNTILSLGLTCGSIFAVLIPALLSGKNVYIMSLLVCAYTITMTLLIVIGFNKKSLASILACGSGVVLTGLITLIMDRVLMLTGIVDEHSLYLANLSTENPINLRAIIFAGIIIGAMGAVMDVAISISSSLWEIKENSERISFKTLLRSGLTIGRDIMGTMANTLILAYIGSSLSVVLILSVYSSSLLGLFNTEMIIVEILQALVGSIGILFTMPLTALFCSILYLQDKRR